MIRLGRPEDLPAIRALVQRAYEHYIARIGRKPGPLLDDYAALVSKKRVHVLSDDGIKGILVLIPEDRAMLLDNIAVDPDAQGRGYGRSLLEFAEQSALAAGCEFDPPLHQRGDDREHRVVLADRVRRDASSRGEWAPPGLHV